ncbi:ATP-binding protein [Roseibium polysiphoniae]|uniref:ATP-binding protein n=1 Tax=Roseibium polysiphoniae TaxID=2571221 RepID=A0A944GSF4_9HYPH|nr:AAA family ATPase [Roseibium polysiphoniae]MBS8260259.1 ATP-binding protein [Roseibium polysiphoniae]
MILSFAVSGYRSLRNLVLPLDQVTVVTGANGSGKSSLYRSIRLLADVAQGRAISSLAREGGLTSTLWAGPEIISRTMKSGEVPVQGTRRTAVVSLKLGFSDEDYGYAIDLGLPVGDGTSFFNSDPEIKAEALWAGEALTRHNEIASRNGPSVRVLNGQGHRVPVMQNLASYDSMMTHAADPRDALELLVMRERMRSWRFYDHLRTDLDAPGRVPRIGTRTTALSGDGADLAAALRTIQEIGNPRLLDEAVEDAFPGSRIEIRVTDGLFEVLMYQHGLLRPLRTSELSDGTMRYLLLIAVLLTPRPPPLLVLNEPETSLHPRLLEPLGRLVATAAEKTQVILVTHAHQLADQLAICDGCLRYELRKELGETVIDNVDPPRWNWPKR